MGGGLFPPVRRPRVVGVLAPGPRLACRADRARGYRLSRSERNLLRLRTPRAVGTDRLLLRDGRPGSGRSGERQRRSAALGLRDARFGRRHLHPHRAGAPGRARPGDSARLRVTVAVDAPGTESGGSASGPGGAASRRRRGRAPSRGPARVVRRSSDRPRDQRRRHRPAPVVLLPLARRRSRRRGDARAGDRPGHARLAAPGSLGLHRRRARRPRGGLEVPLRPHPHVAVVLRGLAGSGGGGDRPRLRDPPAARARRGPAGAGPGPRDGAGALLPPARLSGSALGRTPLRSSAAAGHRAPGSPGRGSPRRAQPSRGRAARVRARRAHRRRRQAPVGHAPARKRLRPARTRRGRDSERRHRPGRSRHRQPDARPRPVAGPRPRGLRHVRRRIAGRPRATRQAGFDLRRRSPGVLHPPLDG